MSQRAGDLGSILMGCSNSYNLKKYGSAEACLDAEFSNKNTILTYEEAKETQDEQAKVRNQYIIYGLIAVAGYFAYKKFKK